MDAPQFCLMVMSLATSSCSRSSFAIGLPFPHIISFETALSPFPFKSSLKFQIPDLFKLSFLSFYQSHFRNYFIPYNDVIILAAFPRTMISFCILIFVKLIQLFLSLYLLITFYPVFSFASLNISCPVCNEISSSIRINGLKKCLNSTLNAFLIELSFHQN